MIFQILTYENIDINIFLSKETMIFVEKDMVEIMLGTRLREILCSKKMTIAEVAEMSDLPLETVRNIYYGKTTDPKISTVLQLSKALDMSVNCLMGQCSHSKEERAILTHYRMCGNHGKSLIGLVAKYEALTAKAERDCVEKHKIPCLITRGD